MEGKQGEGYYRARRSVASPRRGHSDKSLEETRDRGRQLKGKHIPAREQPVPRPRGRSVGAAAGRPMWLWRALESAHGTLAFALCEARGTSW